MSNSVHVGDRHEDQTIVFKLFSPKSSGIFRRSRRVAMQAGYSQNQNAFASVVMNDVIQASRKIEILLLRLKPILVPCAVFRRWLKASKCGKTNPDHSSLCSAFRLLASGQNLLPARSGHSAGTRSTVLHVGGRTRESGVDAVTTG